jgi:hypothetical protein
MGIYYSDDIYGILLYNYIDDICNTVYEKTSDTIFTSEMINEAKQSYQEFCKMGINHLSIKIYTSTTNSYSNENNTYMSWRPVTKQFLFER